MGFAFGSFEKNLTFLPVYLKEKENLHIIFVSLVNELKMCLKIALLSSLFIPPQS